MKTRKCTNCKEPFTPWNSLQKYCFKTECIQALRQEKEKKEWDKRRKKMKSDLMTLQDYIKIAQQVFNKYIRLSNQKYCISCSKPLKGKFDAGHYMNANNHWNVRFDERNVHSQCVECNQHKHGNLLEYRKQLEFYYGITWLNELEQDARITRKFTIPELKEIIEKYKKKIKDISELK
jgi:hypothetical protein